MTTPSRARLQELLGIGATQALTAAQETELDTLLAAFPDQDADEFELAAAALHLGLIDTSEELPTALAEQLYLTAAAIVPAQTAEPAKPRGDRPARSAWMAWSGWAVAASLAGVLAFALAQKPTERIVVKIVEVQVPGPEREKIVYKQRPIEEKIAEFRKEGKIFAEAKGGLTATVAWSGTKQDGVLEVSGLPVTVGANAQYQLWIFDKTRGKDGKSPPPISAGVFDVDAKGVTTFVPVKTSLPVGEAAVFAISKEPRGGGVQPTEVLLVIPAKAG